jgi:chemotaxis signal transduction protein
VNPPNHEPTTFLPWRVLQARAQALMAPAVTDKAQDILLLFAQGQDTFALPITKIVEILPLTHCSRLPFMPACLPGVANIHNRLVGLLDISVLLGHDAQSSTTLTHSLLIVLSSHHAELALLANQVLDIRYAETTISPWQPNTSDEQLSATWILGVDEEKHILLRPDELFQDPRLSNYIST